MPSLEDAYLILVSEDDLRSGEPMSSDNCPLGRALRREIRPEFLKVGWGRVEMTQLGESAVYSINDRATQNLIAYDMGVGKLEPFAATLWKLGPESAGNGEEFLRKCHLEPMEWIRRRRLKERAGRSKA